MAMYGKQHFKPKYPLVLLLTKIKSFFNLSFNKLQKDFVNIHGVSEKLISFQMYRVFQRNSYHFRCIGYFREIHIISDI